VTEQVFLNFLFNTRIYPSYFTLRPVGVSKIELWWQLVGADCFTSQSCNPTKALKRIMEKDSITRLWE